jgi:hypothetical protein
VPAANGHQPRLDEFQGKVTLADESLRPQWSGMSPDGSLLDLAEQPLFS